MEHFKAGLQGIMTYIKKKISVGCGGEEVIEDKSRDTGLVRRLLLPSHHMGWIFDKFYIIYFSLGARVEENSGLF